MNTWTEVLMVLMVMGITYAITSLRVCARRVSSVEIRLAEARSRIESLEKRNEERELWREWKRDRAKRARLWEQVEAAHDAARARELGPDGNAVMTPEWRAAIDSYEFHERNMEDHWGWRCVRAPSKPGYIDAEPDAIYFDLDDEDRYAAD